MKLDRTTRVELVGRGKLSLNPNQHIATGGEASVYRAAGTVIKLYTNPAKLRQPGMLENLRQLTAFTHPYIVAPQELVLSETGDPIGYYMALVDDDEALSSLFTNSYRQSNGFGVVEASLLVDRMLKVMEFAHDHDAILVDPNELNWTTVVSAGIEREPRVFDVDSWIVGSYRPPTVPMMASIRDWHHGTIGHVTDRFAIGVVTFQVYVGIHPYKGTLAGYERSELIRRMQDNASVFTPGIRLNQAVRDFSCIPRSLLGWYEAAFQHGERSAPPSPFDTGVGTPSRKVRVMRVVTTAIGSLKYEKLFEKQGDFITRVFPCGVVLTAAGLLIDLQSSREIGNHLPETCEVIQTGDGWMVASGGHQPSFTFVDGVSFERSPLSLQLDSRSLVRYQNRLFAVTDRGLTELLLKRFARPILTVGHTWQTMVNSTRWFDGVGVLDAMGATYLVVPFNTDSCTQVRVRELDGLHVVAAKNGHRFMSVITVDAGGEYRKLELTFDKPYGSYIVWQGEAESSELNMSLLPRGVAATVVQDGQLVIFVPTSGTVNRVSDRDITTDMHLGNWGDRVVFIRDGQLWQVSMT